MAETSKVCFYVTGFGKFAHILENPSSFLVRALPAILGDCPGVELSHHEVVTVSVEHCDEALSKIKAMISAHPGQKHMVVNFGVAASRRCFSLESVGRNIKDFRCPDENGNKFCNEKIDPECELDCKVKTELDLETVCKELSARGHKVEVSCDAGEYICNYMFYRNLECFAKEKDVRSLFVHIPELRTISGPEQQAFAKDLFCELAKIF